MKQTGFTLFELLVTLLILGILVAIAIPMFAGIRHASELAAAEQEVAGFLNRARWLAITSGRTQTTIQLADCSGGGADCGAIEVLDAGGAVLARADVKQYGATLNPVAALPYTLDNRGFVTPGAIPSLTVTSTKLGETKTVAVTQLGKVQTS